MHGVGCTAELGKGGREGFGSLFCQPLAAEGPEEGGRCWRRVPAQGTRSNRRLFAKQVRQWVGGAGHEVQPWVRVLARSKQCRAWAASNKGIGKEVPREAGDELEGGSTDAGRLHPQVFYATSRYGLFETFRDALAKYRKTDFAQRFLTAATAGGCAALISCPVEVRTGVTCQGPLASACTLATCAVAAALVALELCRRCVTRLTYPSRTIGVPRTDVERRLAAGGQEAQLQVGN
eukprot:scaffold166696_cov31-Tisochrysis_lutea.AAC.7